MSFSPSIEMFTLCKKYVLKLININWGKSIVNFNIMFLKYFNKITKKSKILDLLIRPKIVVIRRSYEIVHSEILPKGLNNTNKFDVKHSCLFYLLWLSIGEQFYGWDTIQKAAHNYWWLLTSGDQNTDSFSWVHSPSLLFWNSGKKRRNKTDVHWNEHYKV